MEPKYIKIASIAFSIHLLMLYRLYPGFLVAFSFFLRSPAPPPVPLVLFPTEPKLNPPPPILSLELKGPPIPDPAPDIEFN